MKQQEPLQPFALLLAVLAGISIGLLLPLHGTEDVLESRPAAVAAFAGQEPMSFSIAPVPSNPPLAQPETEAVPTATSPATTPAPDAGAFSITALQAGPVQAAGRILIYHTHTYEAYAQTQPAYLETEKWRTADESCNMIRVGEELTLLLRGLGYEVVHDTTAFEPPDLNSAYARSLAMLEGRTQAGESYDLYIDLHRDAYVEGQAGDNTVQMGGVSLARLMLLIGKGEGYANAAGDQRPDWERNLGVAQTITDGLNRQAPGLCKQVRLKSGRFNQHIGNACILVEVGNNRNTLKEALAAMPYLADAIDACLGASLQR